MGTSLRVARKMQLQFNNVYLPMYAHKAIEIYTVRCLLIYSKIYSSILHITILCYIYGFLYFKMISFFVILAALLHSAINGYLSMLLYGVFSQSLCSLHLSKERGWAGLRGLRCNCAETGYNVWLPRARTRQTETKEVICLCWNPGKYYMNILACTYNMFH